MPPAPASLITSRPTATATQIAPGAGGGYHISEIPIVFGTTAFSTGKADSGQEFLLSQQMRHAWASFAKDPVDGLTGLGWKKYDENVASLNRLGFGNEAGVTFEVNAEYDAACDAAGL
jgi:carboxylesterase type B